MLPKKVQKTESSYEWLVSGIFALLLCCASMYIQQPHIAIFCFGVYLVLRFNKLPPFFEKYSEKFFIVISTIIIITVGFIGRAVMFIKYRSLWLDEAGLAEKIVGQNWAELLTGPPINAQSAPVLYVIAVKAVCFVFGTSENSLRLFSLFSFLLLLVCEWFFLKKILKMDNIKTWLVLALTAVIPNYVYYSNELKPYMSDAFFVVLALLLYAFYTQNKLSLIKLTVFYVLILGFSFPAIFFIGGILATEFLSLAFARDKKRALYVLISGVSIIAIFSLYYYWWMLPSLGEMDDYWNKSSDKSLFEVFSIVLVISSYFLYTYKKLPLIYLTIFYLLILGFCPPAIFFVGGILVVELFVAAFARDKKQFGSIFAHILSIAMVFNLYYLLRAQFVSESLSNFLNNPEGKTKLVTEVKNIFASSHLASGFDSTCVYALVPLAILGIYSLIKQKNKIAYSVVLSMLFAVLASSIGKWPLNSRLWLFLPAVVLLYSSIGYDLISKSNNIVIQRVAFCLFFGITLNYAYVSSDMLNIFKGGGTYLQGEEVNPLIKYVKDNIKDDEKLYVYKASVPAVKFKNGYKSLKIGKSTRDNIIFGTKLEEWNQNELGVELDSIVKSRKAYLLFSHHWTQITPGLYVLSQYGIVTLVLKENNTLLFYFKANE